MIRSLADQRTTMLIVTHEMAFARDVADQVVFMDGGVVVEQGDPEEIINHPRRNGPASSWPGSASSERLTGHKTAPLAAHHLRRLALA